MKDVPCMLAATRRKAIRHKFNLSLNLPARQLSSLDKAPLKHFLISVFSD
jgi:hypothetical protein